MKSRRQFIVLLDIGNTHTHLGLADAQQVYRQWDIPTRDWESGDAQQKINRLLRGRIPFGIGFCSVVPEAIPFVQVLAREQWHIRAVELTHKTVWGIAIDYPKPATIGPDRLANAMAVARHYSVPAIVIDFGTAVTFDVIDRNRQYAGGIIAPGLSAMTDYLYEKTARLPRIRIRETGSVIGRNTREAMLIGAVHGYRGLIRELLLELRRELACRKLAVVATGGYASLIAAKLPEITAVDPRLTLEGVRLCWFARNTLANSAY